MLISKQALANARHNIWMYLGRSESGLRIIELYRAVAGRDVSVTDSSVDLVIEGYPRSANTYAVAAFRVAQERDIRLAHHVHGPAQVLRAIKFGIPCLVIVREPVAAVASLLQRYPFLKINNALLNYVSFYKPLVALTDRFVLAGFEQAVSDFNQVISAINMKYNTHFSILDTECDEAEVMRLIEKMDRRDQGKETVGEMTVARPSLLRAERAVELRQCIVDAEPELVDEAIKIYQKLSIASVADFPGAGA